jgi:peptidoglycan/LPS O-acetylase OafA/YrhL
VRDEKITFANQLRGIAVLLVALGHYTGLYWGDRTLVAAYIRAPILTGSSSHVASALVIPTLNYGPFGVALFFLISGFVIPFSLEKLGVVRFAFARVMRIFPTFWVATAVILGVTALSGHHWGVASVFRPDQVVDSALLISPQLGEPTIDMVSWTLAIEVIFYACAALMWPFVRRASCFALVNFALVVLAWLTWAPARWDSFTLFELPVSMAATRYEMMMVCFIFIGTLFNYRLRSKISVSELAGSSAAIFAAFLMMWQHTQFSGQFWHDPLNYGYALVVFSACFALRKRFRPSRLLDFVADISYPLYLVHAVCGYTIMRFLMSVGLPYVLAAVSAFCTVVAIAYFLHVVVELPTAAAGKRWGARKAAMVKGAPQEQPVTRPC